MATENVLRFPQKPKGQSKIAEKISFFTTARGIHFSHKFMAAAATGIGAVFWAYDQFFISQYITFVRAYRYKKIGVLDSIKKKHCLFDLQNSKLHT